MESTYQVRGGKAYNTNFNTRYTSSVSLGKEITVRGKNTLQFGGRVMYNGGFRYTPYDPVLSAQENTYVPLEGATNEGQVNPYFRIDTRISYRINKPKTASVLSLDIQNITNRFNPHSVGYNAVENELYFRFHSGGLIPVLSYQIDF